MEKHSGEALAKMAGQVWDRLDAKGREELAAGGYNIVTASEADAVKIKEAGLQLEADWIAKMKAAGRDGAAALETFKSHVAEIQGTQ